MGEKAKNSRKGAVSSESASRNVSDEKRAELRRRLAEIESFIQRAQQDENTKNLLTYIADLKKDLRAKKYGLVFEEHREQIDDDLDNNTPVLTEDKELFINGGGEINFLIEGDNLASLQLLEKTHKGKIDLIYIDPPYNTEKKDFIYGDKRVGEDDLFRHSKWLSFMSKRLPLAKKLLSERGVIFISIDDHEQAQLKLLCDEVFGPGNFLAQIVWERAFSPINLKKHFSEAHDYILCYARDIKSAVCKGIKRSDEANKRYSNPDNDPRGVWSSSDLSVGPAVQENIYPITTPAGRVVLPPSGYSWRTPKETFLEYLADNRIWFGPKGDGVPRIKRFLSELKKDGITPMTIWKYTEVDHSQGATQKLAKIFDGQKVFEYPKPVGLIERCLQLYSGKESTVLDFFAGSGTTGHAVMKINKDDGGKRKFILCTNNEGDICRKVTHERIKRAIKREGYEASLKYFRVDFIPLTDRLYFDYADELLEHIRELVELENAINFTGNVRIAIILKDEELDAFASSLGETTECEAVYLAHNILLSDEQRKLFNRRNIKINVIPNYYYKELSIS